MIAVEPTVREILADKSCTAANLKAAIEAVLGWTFSTAFSDVHGIDDVQDALTDALLAVERTYVGALRDE